jgi:glycosyltransferase involved in cell wall biosynthesis
MTTLRIAMSLYNQVGKGTYWRALALGQELATRGHQVTLLAISPQRRRGFKSHSTGGVTVVETPDLMPGSLRSGWDPWDALCRVGWLRSRTFDLVHTFENRPVAWLPALHLHRKQRIPLLSDWCDWFGRGGSVEERPNPLLRGLLRPVETFFEEVPRRRADGVTVINRVLHQKAVTLGVPPDRILLLPNGSNVRDIVPGDRAAARGRLGLPADVKLVAYTGAIFWRDARLLAAAFDRVHQARPDARLLMVGYCNVAVEELVQAPEAVIRSGPISYRALNDYLAACDLGWLPLSNSGANQGRFPLKFNDFLAAGRAVVATDVGDLGDLMRQEPIGRLVPDAPDALARAVLDLLADDTQRARQGQHARQLAEGRASWSVMGEAVEQFYKRILRRNG